MKRLAFLVVVACLCALPGTGRAGMITYTWVNDLGNVLSGSFSVPTSVLAAGQITPSDVTTWSFTTTVGNTYTPSSSTLLSIENPPSDVLHIDPTTGAFTDLNASLVFELNVPQTDLSIEADKGWQTTGGELWSEAPPAGELLDSGFGHWTISGVPAQSTAAPEPASLTLLSLGALGLLGYRWRTRKAV